MVAISIVNMSFLRAPTTKKKAARTRTSRGGISPGGSVAAQGMLGALGPPRRLDLPQLLVVAVIFLLSWEISIPSFPQAEDPSLGSCQSDSPGSAPSAPSIIELSRLSGEWTGTETLTSVGQCKLEGGSESLSYPVRVRWTVEGNVEISLPAWPGVYPYTFAGEIQPDLRLSLELATSAMCGGTAHPFTAHYSNIIQVNGDTLTLEMDATEVWCPGSCIFRRQYSIRKPLTTP